MKKNWKRLIAFALSAAMLFALTACGATGAAPSAPEPAAAVEEAAEPSGEAEAEPAEGELSAYDQAIADRKAKAEETGEYQKVVYAAFDYAVKNAGELGKVADKARAEAGGEEEDGEAKHYNEGEDTSIDDAVHTYRNNNILKLYSVDMNDPINTKYKSDSSNPNLTNATELKINGPTLIKFNNKKVEEYIEGTDSIIDYLN